MDYGNRGMLNPIPWETVTSDANRRPVVPADSGLILGGVVWKVTLLSVKFTPASDGLRIRS